LCGHSGWGLDRFVALVVVGTNLDICSNLLQTWRKLDESKELGWLLAGYKRRAIVVRQVPSGKQLGCDVMTHDALRYMHSLAFTANQPRLPSLTSYPGLSSRLINNPSLALARADR
jgi:hypothetical protein